MVDEWVEREMLRGLQGLLALRLPGAPAADAVGMTADIWLVAIEPRAAAWQEELDANRIRQAFTALFTRVRQWPSPAEFLDALPARAPQPALPAPPLTPEQRKRNLNRLNELTASIFKRMPQ